MGSWSETLDLIKGESSISPLDQIRRNAVSTLADIRQRNVTCYYSGWLTADPRVNTSINDNDMNGLMNTVHGLDRGKGLDLVLHTPGGDLAATEAIVSYLRDCFGKDIVAIVPQMAMSAGTMIACSCRKILMGKQSSLGPTDPQYGGVAAGGVVEEFEKAIEQIAKNPASVPVWSQIISQYHPTFLGDCEKAVKMSKQIVGEWIRGNMLAGDPEVEEKVARITSKLCDHSESVMHNRHFSHSDLSELGLTVELLENDDELQDAVLTLHHVFMITFDQSSAIKIIENNKGSSWIVSGANPVRS